MGVFEKFKERLKKARTGFGLKVKAIFTKEQVADEDFFEELEETLITGDVGVNTAVRLCESLRECRDREGITSPEELLGILRKEMKQILTVGSPELNFAATPPTVFLIVGVNGSGKTTSIAKLAYRFKNEGKSVMIAAADTFRAAAIDQLAEWALRVGVPIIKHQPGADPGAVAYDAVEAAIARSMDILIVDTAGRLHTQKNLMEELKKIRRVISRRIEDAPHETLLVLDATTGQNAIRQAEVFSQAVEVTGIILTKMDGTAKGGIVTAVCDRIGVPVRFVGLGEDLDNLCPFDVDVFVDAILE